MVIPDALITLSQQITPTLSAGFVQGIPDALINLSQQITPTLSAGFVLVALLAAHVVPYFKDRYGMRKYPGPFWAKFTDIWFAHVARDGHRTEVLYRLHQKYGTHVRIAPNHLSIVDPRALQIVYAYGNKVTKSDFYDATITIRPTSFNIRDREVHRRQRRLINPVFTTKRIAEFEPRIREHVTALIRQWDRLCAEATKGSSGSEGGGWKGANGRLWMDAVSWMNYLAFDIVGDLVFGSPFGMIENGNDLAPKEEGADGNTRQSNVSAVESRNERAKYLISTALLPAWWRPTVLKVLKLFLRQQGATTFAGIVSAAITKRLDNPTDRTDLISVFQSGEGKLLDRQEIIAEAISQISAGSGPESITFSAVLYHLARNPRAQRKLQEELDDCLGADHDVASTLDQVTRLPYLEKVINEAMRLSPSAALGLPRVMPEGGLNVTGDHFPEGAILSVPTYCIHRDKAVWGEDVEDFRPERWDEQDSELMKKTHNPFSFGPRACVGRHLAMLELQIAISSILRRYDFVLEKPDQPLETSEDFLRNIVVCRVGIKRRDL